MTIRWTMLTSLSLAAFLPAAMPADPPLAVVDFRHGDLKISPNGRYLVHADGTPFFYLGDTAWELFHRLNREDADKYLENRRQKGFTVIQAVVLAELDGLDAPNANGDRPLIDNDPTRFNEPYFRHVDHIVHSAREKGMYIGMLPTWGDKVVQAWGKGPVIFNRENAGKYGRLLGARYGNEPNIIWILGGDRNPDGCEEVWRAMAAGLREGDVGRHLITYHPAGGHSSSEWLQREDWLDFNLLQSGHDRKDKPNDLMIDRDFALTPAKPTLDGEARYENHPVNWKPEQNGWFDQYDVRQAAYWAVFAGAAGHTYGCHDVWQMKTPGTEAVGFARGVWYESLDLPGAGQMNYLRRLMLSRPFLSRVPDQTAIAAPQGEGAGRARATRGDGYLFVYVPTGRLVSIHPGSISETTVQAWWYDPRSGNVTRIGLYPKKDVMEFRAPGNPGRGNDWVLVLDDAARKFPEPGKPER